MKRLEKKKKKRKKMMIYPQGSKFFVAWSVILSAALLYVCIFLPYFTAFYEDDELTTWDTIIIGVIDVIFLLDIFITFNTALVDKKGKTIDDRCVIAKKYLKFWFWLDILTILPITLIVDYTLLGVYPDIAAIARFYKIIRVARVGRIFKMFEKKHRSNNTFSEIFGKMQELLYYFFIVVLFCHFFACFFFQVSEQPAKNYKIDLSSIRRTDIC